MKHAKRLTRRMKKLLMKKGFVPEDWFYISQREDMLLIIHKVTGERKLII